MTLMAFATPSASAETPPPPPPPAHSMLALRLFYAFSHCAINCARCAKANGTLDV